MRIGKRGASRVQEMVVQRRELASAMSRQRPQTWEMSRGKGSISLKEIGPDPRVKMWFRISGGTLSRADGREATVVLIVGCVYRGRCQ